MKTGSILKSNLFKTTPTLKARPIFNHKRQKKGDLCAKKYFADHLKNERERERAKRQRLIIQRFQIEL
jgi:hypothetical protein